MLDNESSTVETDLIEQDESDIATVEQTDETELPSDPEALRQFAEEQQAKRIEAEREAKRQKREAERHQENATEQKTKATYWANEAKRKQAESADSKAVESSKQSTTPDVKSALKGLDLNEYILMEDGVEKLVGDLEERGVIVTPKRLEQMLNDRESKTRTMGVKYQGLVNEYPDILNTKSELYKEATVIFDRLAEDEPDLPESTRHRLATLEAAAKIGYKKPKTEAAPVSRLRGAQGDAGNRSAGGGGQSLTVTDADRRTAKKMLGSDAPTDPKALDALILDSKKQVAAQNKRTA
jgi:hypothetical protein